MANWYPSLVVQLQSLKNGIETIKFKILDTLALPIILMAAAMILTWVLPSGEFATEENESGIEVVIPGSFEKSVEKEYLSPVVLFTVVPQAFADAQYTLRQMV